MYTHGKRENFSFRHWLEVNRHSIVSSGRTESASNYESQRLERERASLAKITAAAEAGDKGAIEALAKRNQYITKIKQTKTDFEKQWGHLR